MWIFITKVIALGMASLLLLVALASKRVVGSWINAASIFSLFWFAYTAFPLVFAWGVPINIGAVFYIIIFNALFASSVVLFDWNSALRSNGEKISANAVFGSRSLVFVLFFVSVLSVFCIYQGMLVQGLEFSTNIIEFASNYASLRYANALVDSVYSRLGFLLYFPTIIVGGFAWGASRSAKMRILILCASFIPVLMMMLLQSAKGPFLLALALFIGAILVTRIYDKKYHLIDRKSACTLMKWGIACFALIVLTFLSRGADKQGDAESMLEFLWYYILSYSSGHLYAFADWFSGRYFGDSLVLYRDDGLTYGFYTFMSFFRMLGDDRPVPLGVYDEFFDYNGILTTNVYTAFRGLITDFSFVGSLAVGLVAGFFCNWICFRLYSRRNSAFFAVSFVYFFGFAYQSFGVSTFTWTSVPVSFAMLVTFFWIYFGIRRRTNHIRASEVGVADC